MEVVHKDVYVHNIPCRIYEPEDSANLKASAVNVFIGLGGRIDADLASRDPWLNNNADALARTFAEHGFFALEVSPPGHGKFHVPFSIDNYVSTANYLAEFVRNANDIAEFVSNAHRFEHVCGFGHSLGAIACARSAAENIDIPYKAISLLSPPISLKEALDRFKIPFLYSLVEGTSLEEPLCKAGLIIADNAVYPHGFRYEPNAFAHLKLDSASGFVKELVNAESLDDLTIPEETGVLVVYAENDGLMYGRLTKDLKENLESRWRNIAPHSKMLTYPADHNFTSKDRPGEVMTAPEFQDVVEKSVEMFL